MRVKEDKRRDRFLATHLDAYRYIEMILFAKRCTHSGDQYFWLSWRLIANNSDQIWNPKARIIGNQKSGGCQGQKSDDAFGNFTVASD